jgi:RNA polymerase sigma-70 factor, ECF subfamily
MLSAKRVSQHHPLHRPLPARPALVDVMPRVAAANGPSAGAPRWFGQLLVSLQGPLMARALLFDACPSDARDAVQQASERALRRFSAKVTPDHARGWIFTILERVLISAWRRRQRLYFQSPTAEVEHLLTPEAEDEPAWLSLSLAEIRAALEELSPLLRQTYELCELQGLSYEAAAAQLGSCPCTVGTRLFRARVKLRQILARQLPAGDDKAEGNAGVDFAAPPAPSRPAPTCWPR